MGKAWCFELTRWNYEERPTRIWSLEKPEPLTDSMASAKEVQTKQEITDLLEMDYTSGVMENPDGSLKRLMVKRVQ